MSMVSNGTAGDLAGEGAAMTRPFHFRGVTIPTRGPGAGPRPASRPPERL